MRKKVQSGIIEAGYSRKIPSIDIVALSKKAHAAVAVGDVLTYRGCKKAAAEAGERLLSIDELAQ